MRVSVLVLATAVCLDCGLTSAVLAADMPVKARAYAPLMPPAYDWSGLYIGANVGGGWSNRSLDIAGMAWHDLFSTEFIGGMQLGYNLHAGHFLVGVEGDLDWAGFTHPNLPIPTPVGPALFSAKQDWISTVAARFGLTFDRWLAYGKVGGGWARDVAGLNLPNGTGWTASSTNSGWLAGGGLEYGFKPNWTVKLEYDYLALGNWTTSTVPAGTWNRDVQMIKAGINYKFESGVPPATTTFPMPKEKTPASDEDTENLAKASQNPVATLITVPFQNNANFRTGPFNRTQDVLNIQPVVPLKLGTDWNVIARTIAPLMSQPDPVFDHSTDGIGDITEELFLSPANSGIKDFFWGLGPIVTMPSASDVILGTGKVLLGPTAVVISELLT
jgi:opacity protein-like surface antigen